MTILPITGAADDVPRITDAAVDGFIVWTTSDDDPILAAVQAMKRPAVVHGGPAVRGLGLVGIDTGQRHAQWARSRSRARNVRRS